jgi:hypothetical protein
VVRRGGIGEGEGAEPAGGFLKAGPETRDVGVKLLGVSGVGDDGGGGAFFLVEGPLGGLAGLEGLGGPASGGRQALESEGAGGVDEPDDVAEVVPAGFEEDGGVEDDGGGGVAAEGTGDGFFEGQPHAGVEDALKVAELVGVVEDEGGQSGAVDFIWVVGAEDGGAETAEDGLAGGGLIEQGVADSVGVEDVGAQVG